VGTSLEEPHRTYLVSGQGDSALIEVLRLRISQYRQDRILEELFVKLPKLNDAVKGLHKRFAGPCLGMFDAFEALEKEPEFALARGWLTKRLRRDTGVILHLKERMFADLFEMPGIKISFQNRLLIYLLYKCGGFVPTSEGIEDVMKMQAIPRDRVILRHGIKEDRNLQQVLSETLYQEVATSFVDGKPRMQGDEILWRGGYFGFPGSQAAARTLGDEVRQEWRKEYLPGATALTALSLCASIAGLLLRDHPADQRLRVTLHRTMTVGDEELLQQCCEYVGTSIFPVKPAAARTFPAANATIGLAYKCREIVRSAKDASPHDIREAMNDLNLDTASRDMSSRVGFVLAIPVVQPETAAGFSGPNPVVGVLYIDSEAPSYFIGDAPVKDLVAMVERFVRACESIDSASANRIRNIPIGKAKNSVPAKETVPSAAAAVLQIVKDVSPPRTNQPFQLNFDHADFVPA